MAIFTLLDMENFPARPFTDIHLGPNAVCALSYRVAVEGQFVIVFYKDVQWSVLAVPGVFDLSVPGRLWHVEQHLQPGAHLVLPPGSPRLDGLAPAACGPVPVGVTDSSWDVPSHLSSSLPTSLLPTRVFPLLPISLGSTSGPTQTLQRAWRCRGYWRRSCWGLRCIGAI